MSASQVPYLKSRTRTKDRDVRVANYSQMSFNYFIHISRHVSILKLSGAATYSLRLEPVHIGLFPKSVC